MEDLTQNLTDDITRYYQQYQQCQTQESQDEEHSGYRTLFTIVDSIFTILKIVPVVILILYVVATIHQHSKTSCASVIPISRANYQISNALRERYVIIKDSTEVCYEDVRYDCKYYYIDSVNRCVQFYTTLPEENTELISERYLDEVPTLTDVPVKPGNDSTSKKKKKPIDVTKSRSHEKRELEDSESTGAGSSDGDGSDGDGSRRESKRESTFIQDILREVLIDYLFPDGV